VKSTAEDRVKTAEDRVKTAEDRLKIVRSALPFARQRSRSNTRDQDHDMWCHSIVLLVPLLLPVLRLKSAFLPARKPNDACRATRRRDRPGATCARAAMAAL
jgi:hypothetical protein